MNSCSESLNACSGYFNTVCVCGTLFVAIPGDNIQGRGRLPKVLAVAAVVIVVEYDPGMRPQTVDIKNYPFGVRMGKKTCLLVQQEDMSC